MKYIIAVTFASFYVLNTKVSPTIENNKLDELTQKIQTHFSPFLDHHDKILFEQINGDI